MNFYFKTFGAFERLSGLVISLIGSVYYEIIVNWYF